MTANTEPTATAREKPRVALAIATVFGLGRLRPGPGTWGSMAGVLLGWLFLSFWPHTFYLHTSRGSLGWVVPYFVPAMALCVAVAAAGVWSAQRVAAYARIEDPQYVVIDEVSGQHLTLLLAGALIAPVNWKYLLVGFILFRVFDIWKPFPARQAERLPGGWGIMADDWVAGIYAALGLWVARTLGL